MKTLRTGLTALACSALAIVQAQGQVTVDVSKITCREFRNYSITDPNNIALWLSGYYNGRRGNTLLDVSALQTNLEKLKDYCVTSPTITVMQAVETIFSKP